MVLFSRRRENTPSWRATRFVYLGRGVCTTAFFFIPRSDSQAGGEKGERGTGGGVKGKITQEWALVCFFFAIFLRPRRGFACFWVGVGGGILIRPKCLSLPPALATIPTTTTKPPTTHM